jgi:PAS domain S-box-containing protein
MDFQTPNSRKATPHDGSDISFLYEQTIQHSPDIIAIVDSGYVYRFVNNSYLKRHGKTEGDIIGHHASNIWGPEVFESKIKPHFDRCVSGEAVRYQEWFSYPEHGERYMDVSYHPVTADGGSVRYIAATIRDITELKQMETALRESEMKYRSLVDLTSDSVYELDEQMRYTYVSNRGGDISGRKPEDHIGKTPFDYMSEKEKERVLGFIRDKLDPPQSLIGFENTLMGEDGQPVIVETSAVPIYDVHGRFFGYLCVDRDITERIRAEDELRRQKEHLTSILETSLDGIAVTSEDRRVVYGNRALAHMFGYDDVDDLIGTSTDSYFAPGSHGPLEQMRERLDRGEVVDDIVDFVAMKRDGSTFDAELRVGSFFEESRRLDVAAIRDVSDRKRMEFQLNQSGKLAAIGELAAGVAHEINNPIAAIDVHVGLIHDVFEEIKSKIDDSYVRQVEKYVREIDHLVERCRAVTDSLLSFTRAPRGEPRPYAINELLRETVAMVSSLSLSEVNFEFAFDSELPSYWGAPTLLQQVFVNLLTNAVKATEPEGTVMVTTRRADEGAVQIAITDSGHGIPDNIKGRIFDPFFTTSPEGEGTGLGLSISYYIIKQIDGAISVDSTPGQGSTFTVTLPIAEEMTGELSETL